MQPDDPLIYDWMCAELEAGKLPVVVFTPDEYVLQGYTVLDWSPLRDTDYSVRGFYVSQVIAYTGQEAEWETECP